LGIDPTAWALAWARVLPTTLIVPAFGLRALPLPARALFALVLAACIAPVLVPPEPPPASWLLELVGQALLGLPVALGAALPLWVATMTGNTVEAVRDPRASQAAFVSVEPGATSLGVLLSLGASAAFLSLGGPARLAEALSASEPLLKPSLTMVALGLAQGIQAAVLLAAPLLALAIFLDAATGLSTRLGGAAALGSSLAALRSLVLLVVAALLFDRLFEALIAWMQSHLP
jgi:flagellar biosynthesis protein FliR